MKLTQGFSTSSSSTFTAEKQVAKKIPGKIERVNLSKEIRNLQSCLTLVCSPWKRLYLASPSKKESQGQSVTVNSRKALYIFKLTPKNVDQTISGQRRPKYNYFVLVTFIEIESKSMIHLLIFLIPPRHYTRQNLNSN